MIAVPDVELVNVSDPGRKRPHNEDSAVTDRELGLALVADGMGGYKAGEVASAIAAKVVLDAVRAGQNKHFFQQQNKPNEATRERDLIRRSIEDANKYIYRTAHNIPQCQGMGTTIVATLFSEGRVTLAHVGDSRIYLFRDNALKQVTNDHSLVQELIDRGFFTPEEAQANTPKNLVTRALGIDEHVEVEMTEMATRPGDIYLLCSDGLNDMVDDEEIRLTLSKYGGNLVQAAHELVQQANASGGRDNISVVLARPHAVTASSAGILEKLQGLWSRDS
ncbi:MAG: Stp1/IreP family PP2C-type Ser/Thr phosphatase [Gammaproteobacteria bacterium]|nr:Stp1/IreP family PP2C-type Ser/Thr phosphatase [Gammaproteobacteria bacterium]